MVGRIPVLDVQPVLDTGLSAKATVGEPMPVRATVFREGHDALGCEVVVIDGRGRRQPPVRMHEEAPGTDRYVAWVTPPGPGAFSFEVQAFSDPLATWLHDGPIKIEAGVDVELMFTEMRLLLQRVKVRKGSPEATTVRAGVAATKLVGRPIEERLSVLAGPEMRRICAEHPIRDMLTVSPAYPAYADRERALFGSWYEFFPRSEGGLRPAIKRLDAIAAMGFDVVYLPPIHPIGEINRKGPNNAVLPAGETTPPDWVGSPWAIGSKDGGHDAVHPDLGTIEDFDAFVARAKELDLEVALDLALQAAPDHPWVESHPEWFTTRADGSIAYAENPPKKYQDIYPINFDNDPDGIYAEVLRVVRHWMRHGVRIFRVDNPHTKPLAFWERLLGEVRRTDPDVLFLAEAFTRPAMMHGLGAVGYHQSYTYFTWRNTKEELTDYLTELATESDKLMRPNLFVNTPDILHAFLQYGGHPAFKIRAALAATASPTWGVYSGYELFEHAAVRAGSEEYLDSEKYQLRPRDWEAAERDGATLAPYLTLLNDIRRRHPALQLLRNVTFHETDDEQVLCYSKTTGTDTVIVVVNLDPFNVHETTVHLDPEQLEQLGSSYTVRDEVTGQEWTWGQANYVRLDPGYEPAHILTVNPGRSAA